jgi:ABC-2 type transport system ATP-binding protein
LIQFENISKSFQKTAVLNGIDLKLDHGDRVALVGSNGAGKTTLIRCLLGEYTCEGKILVAGDCPRDNRSKVLRNISFVPQLPPPLKMPVKNLINLAASLCNSDPKRMISVTESLGLNVDEIRNRIFVKLSGGEKQKLLIGIALGRDCDTMIMDEPSANLDPDARQVFFKLLAAKKDKCTMIISSHRLDEVASLVNRVVELDHGKIVLDDHVDDRVDMASLLDCQIKLCIANPAFAKAIANWNFIGSQNGVNWSGKVAGPDRLRFLGVISRYAALLSEIEMKESNNEKAA